MDEKHQLKVVPLRDSPALTDVVGQLRQFATAIERGEYGDMKSIVTIVFEHDLTKFHVFEWGETTASPDELAGKLMRSATRWMHPQ